MDQIIAPSREEALDAAKRLRMQRREFFRERTHADARAWPDERKNIHAPSR